MREEWIGWGHKDNEFDNSIQSQKYYGISLMQVVSVLLTLSRPYYKQRKWFNYIKVNKWRSVAKGLFERT